MPTLGRNAPKHTLPASASVLLDLLRLAAALLVVIAHLSRPEFSIVMGRDLRPLGELAVPVFFVLSGFVIRFVTVSREHTLRVYLMDRASRIYSVALPAMALTLVTAAVVLRFNPAYAAQTLNPVLNHPMLRVALNLTFLSQSWGLNTVQFADSPFWSLSYECLFYVAYGLFFYLRGTRRVVGLILWVALSGPPILFLLPLWLLGCGLYDLYASLRNRPVATHLRRLTLLYAVLAVAFAGLGHAALLLAPVRLEQAFAALPSPLMLIHQTSNRATMTAIANGTVAAIAMFLLLLLSDLVPMAAKNGFGRRFRRLADGTFTIYLMHYPLMMLARAFGLIRPHAYVLDTVTVTLIVLILIAAAGPADALKSTLRGALTKLALHLQTRAGRSLQSQPRNDTPLGAPTAQP
jgi:peptidoglycan/LPS O-acetylase OafA/YrhL